MSAPFKVKALYDYASAEPDDLTFSNGQIITVIEAEDAEWYTGEYAGQDGQLHEGIFPRNFVERYEPPVPSRPSRPPRKNLPAEAVSIGPSTTTQPEHSVPSTPAPSEAHVTPRDPQSESADVTSDPSIAEHPATMDPATEDKPASIARKAPPVVEKPTTNSFKDRIAAFNKTAAPAPVPFKPLGANPSSFVKKPFVAPPPSRNAYVPPPRETPAPKVYHREEELQAEEQEQKSAPQISALPHEEPSQADDQPKPTSLKERIALLQRQQQEQAARSADSTRRKDKPRRPEHARSDSTDAQDTLYHSSENPTTGTTDVIHHVTSHDTQNTETASHLPAAVLTPPPPARELVSDTNDADDSGAADTEDARDESTEEEKLVARADGRSIANPQSPLATAGLNAEGEIEEEEEEDPEMRRKRELRERMAKMSGGMGMMGLLGGPVPAARKPRPAQEESSYAGTAQEETTHAPPVPVMALPGMTNLRAIPRNTLDSHMEGSTSQATPHAMNEEPERSTNDYVPQGLARSVTVKSNADSISDHPQALPKHELPQASPPPSTRPVPPLPPTFDTPSRELPSAPTTAQEIDDEEEQDDIHSPPQVARATSVRMAASRPVPPPPPPATQAPRGAPPAPTSPTSPQTRAPPPPPPAQLPPRRVETSQPTASRTQADSDEEVTEYDGDYDTDIASGVPHKDALRSHNRESSVEEEALSGDDEMRSPTSPTMRAPPPPIPSSSMRDPPQQPPATQPTFPTRDLPKQPQYDEVASPESTHVPRTAPPPLPQSQPFPSSPPSHRELTDATQHVPHLPPPQPPMTRQDRGEYDPYRYSMPPLVSPTTNPSTQTTTDFERQSYDAPPAERGQYPPPSAFDAPSPSFHQPELSLMPGGSTAPKQSMDLSRSATTSRRSMEAPRIGDQAYIACDIDMAQSSQWWVRENNPPPSILSRSDVLWEEESSSTQKRGGRMTITRDVYILYQDYSQTSINATFDAAEPVHATLEQSHVKPPMPPRKDQLESASDTFGSVIAQTASKSSNNTIGDGSPTEFVTALIREHPAALLPVGSKSYGALIYANLANASTIQHDEIRPGDIVTFRNAKFSGHKGGLHQKYSLEVGKPGVDHVAVIAEWDGTKKKIRAWEQTAEKGKKAKVREESYRVGDLKSGEVRVWRVMPRTWVNWGTA